jgi:hypothetical protein
MVTFGAGCGKTKVFCSWTSSSAVFQTGYSATKGERCSSYGRDTSQPNLLPPSLSSSSANSKDISRGSGICRQCGGLGSGLLNGI